MTGNQSKPTSEGVDGSFFEAVTQAFSEWTEIQEFESDFSVEHNLSRSLRRTLRTGPYRNYADSIEVKREQSGCDLVVNNQIGVKIITHLHDGSKEWIYTELRTLFQEFDQLIIYGHQIPPEQTDLWRQIKRSIRKHSSDQDQLHVLGTIQRKQYRIPLTDRTIAITIFKRYTIYVLFFGFIFVISVILDRLRGQEILGDAYIGAVILLNAVILLLGYYIVKCA